MRPGQSPLPTRSSLAGPRPVPLARPASSGPASRGRARGGFVFFFTQKTAYELGLGIPAEPLFRSFFCVSKNVSVSCAYTQGKREQFSGFNRTLDAINNVFRKFSAFHDETGRLNVDGMNIISND